jgi:hypothetical protein
MNFWHAAAFALISLISCVCGYLILRPIIHVQKDGDK